MSFASGKRSLAISDRSGQAFPYREMVKEWNGSLVHISEFEPKHPQLDPPYHKADAIALQNPRTMKFQQPTDISTINPQAPNDDTIADSGGIFVGVAKKPSFLTIYISPVFPIPVVSLSIECIIDIFKSVTIPPSTFEISGSEAT